MGCFCTTQEEFYCEVLLLDETKLTLTAQQQGIKYWLDPMKTLAEHKDLINTGPPYTLYFGVKSYAEDPCKLKEEITRYQFFLQVKQDVLQDRLPCPLNIAAQLGAYALQSERGDYDPFKHTANYVSEYRFVPDQKEDLEEAIEQFHKALILSLRCCKQEAILKIPGVYQWLGNGGSRNTWHKWRWMWTQV
ncbi:band 4.1-like protein 4A isoform X2 [Hypanus sabinus]|uniref:band 4.1-like protein 4A isoform X2 n=1 Tax=Hypanus sabinus TaxID=79690 RepID=UPI0028C4CAC9|nr:band 4.1-like protein 4A isoform X2 [Hypanus sabinus]